MSSIEVVEAAQEVESLLALIAGDSSKGKEKLDKQVE